MRFSFDKAACQNTRRALRKEWLLTNGRGDYAAGSILGCNTRKYHGLLVVNTAHGRHVLLSALEESVLGGGKEFFFSTRQHPGQLYPHGHEYQEAFRLDQWPQWTYRVGEVRLDRELFLIRGASRLVLRYSLRGSGGFAAPASAPAAPAGLPLHARPHQSQPPGALCRRPSAGGLQRPALRQPAAALFSGSGGVRPRAKQRGRPGRRGRVHPLARLVPRGGIFSGGGTRLPSQRRSSHAGISGNFPAGSGRRAQVYLSVGIAPHTDDLAALWTTESRARTLAHRAGGGPGRAPDPGRTAILHHHAPGRV